MLTPERGDYETLAVSRSILSESTKLMLKAEKMIKDQRFPKSQRLCHTKLIEQLFEPAGSKSFTAFPLRAVFRAVDSDETQVLISVPKRLFKHAVDRNKAKRLIREAYRTNKDLLPATPHMHIAFLWLDNKHHPSHVIIAKTKNLLHRMAETCTKS